MAPSNSRNTMTSPDRTRPVQRAGLEAGAIAAIVVMACSCRIVLNGFNSKTNEAGTIRQRIYTFFSLPQDETKIRSFRQASIRRTPVFAQMGHGDIFDIIIKQ